MSGDLATELLRCGFGVKCIVNRNHRTTQEDSCGQWSTSTHIYALRAGEVSLGEKSFPQSVAGRDLFVLSLSGVTGKGQLPSMVLLHAACVDCP